jgi:hypothetical protein
MIDDGLPMWKHDLLAFPHALLKDAASVLTDLYKEHIRRDVDDGTLKPSDFWMLFHGLLVAATQTHAAIGLLLSQKQPKPFMLQATILNRSLFEILSTVLALTEKPAERTKILESETVKMYCKEFTRATRRYGHDPTWKDYLDVFKTRLADLLKGLDLPSEALYNPELVKADWPTPGVMLGKRRGTPPFISGTRHAALQEFYESHYASQSAQAHARMAAPGAAFLADNPEAQWNPGHIESNIAVDALMFLACILSEIEASGSYPHHPKLVELWSYLRQLTKEATDVWELRYKELVWSKT